MSIISSSRLELFAYFNPEEFERLKKLDEKWIKFFWIFLFIALSIHGLFFVGSIIQKLNLLPKTPPPLTIEIVAPKSGVSEGETKKAPPAPEAKKPTIDDVKKPAPEQKKPAEVGDQPKAPPPPAPKVEEAKPIPPAPVVPPPTTGEKSAPTVDADKYADYSKNPKPRYPMGPYREGIQGTVWLRVQVLEDGSVGTVELAKTSGNDELDESALSTVKKWRFTAAVQGGNAVVQYVRVPITFKLR
jgi:protein TonB